MLSQIRVHELFHQRLSVSYLVLSPGRGSTGFGLELRIVLDLGCSVRGHVVDAFQGLGRVDGVVFWKATVVFHLFFEAL